MADNEHLKILGQGVKEWNAWIKNNPYIEPDLTKADLRGAELSGVDLSFANLHEADLRETNLSGADLMSADLTEANLRGANLRRADLTNGFLAWANFSRADLSGADLQAAWLEGAYLIRADLKEANLIRANLWGANLKGANLEGTVLRYASLVRTNLRGATLSGCNIYGVSAWDLKTDDKTKQDSLVITLPNSEENITVDNIEVAQFIYLLLNNQKLRDVIDTITSKVVLILGRFTGKRKPALDALRDIIRRYDLTPVMFDFRPPINRDITNTIRTLAGMARYVIADITNPRRVPQEIQAIIDMKVPIKFILKPLEGEEEYDVSDWLDYRWVCRDVFRYRTKNQLISGVDKEILSDLEKTERACARLKRMRTLK